jgi:hypothetical protein
VAVQTSGAAADSLQQETNLGLSVDLGFAVLGFGFFLIIIYGNAEASGALPLLAFSKAVTQCTES